SGIRSVAAGSGHHHTGNDIRYASSHYLGLEAARQIAIAMRLTVMCQMTKGLEDKVGAGASRQLERLKWFLWHGNIFRALQVVGDLEMDLDVDDADLAQRKLVKALGEFGGYIGANAGSIPIYGERYRCGEAISNAFVE